jgi:hypothetical protein
MLHRSNQVNEDIKYVQLLWVTKDLQQVIKGGADDRRAAEIQVCLALPVQKYKYGPAAGD